MEKQILLPGDVQLTFHAVDDGEKKRVLIDFISSLTDRSAMELYSAIFEPHERVMRSWLY